jgi:hypothetical protein
VTPKRVILTIVEHTIWKQVRTLADKHPSFPLAQAWLQRHISIASRRQLTDGLRGNEETQSYRAYRQWTIATIESMMNCSLRWPELLITQSYNVGSSQSTLK